MTAQLELHWTRRKAQFFSHFKSLSDEEKGLDALEKIETLLPNHAHADSKCHVCNAALRLLRLRVSGMCGAQCVCLLGGGAKLTSCVCCSTTAAIVVWPCVACTARTRCRCHISAS